MARMRTGSGIAAGIVAGWIALAAPGCRAGPAGCEVVRDGRARVGVFDGRDASRPQLPGRLVPVARGCGKVVDLDFVPGMPDRLVIVDQDGVLRWVDLRTGASGEWARVEVATGWERGLLGLAFHPDFANNGRLFLNRTASKGGLTSQVLAYEARPDAPFAAPPVERHVVYEVAQPYTNHNGGSLLFGPDGMLYVGFGDGGKAGDPHGNGQNGMTALGAMLRLDVDRDPPYAVPPDNPFIGDDRFRPEVWAIGLRNPWKYAFDERGRLVVADVGQDRWEEVTLLDAGANGGWNRREGAHCYQPKTGCEVPGLREPVWAYGHDEGQSITGGFVAGAPDALRGRYVAGDFGSGRIWALALPERVDGAAQVTALGRFALNISTFGRDEAGRIYVGGWKDGTVYRLDVGG